MVFGPELLVSHYLSPKKSPRKPRKLLTTISERGILSLVAGGASALGERMFPTWGGKPTEADAMKVVDRISSITASVSRDPMDHAPAPALALAPAPVDLESAADALLEAAGVFRQGSGVYTGRRLERKIRNERRRMPQATSNPPTSMR
mgnify:CR=1 FL=1